jgi:hypothetical protein
MQERYNVLFLCTGNSARSIWVRRTFLRGSYQAYRKMQKRWLLLITQLTHGNSISNS